MTFLMIFDCLIYFLAFYEIISWHQLFTLICKLIYLVFLMLFPFTIHMKLGHKFTCLNLLYIFNINDGVLIKTFLQTEHINIPQ